jgi:hypothetical protein
MSETPVKAFTRDRMEFDTEPGRGDLVWLLGDGTLSDSLTVRETGAEMRVSLGRIPMRAIGVFVVIFAIGLAIAAFWLGEVGETRNSGALWFMAGAVAIVIGPGFMGILWVMHRAVQEHGWGAIVDKEARTLELPRVGVVASAEEIAFFTQLHRWWWHPGRETNVVQTGVVLRREGGGFVHFPIESQTAAPIDESAGARLAGFFGVEIRRARVGRRECLGLGDC